MAIYSSKNINNSDFSSYYVNPKYNRNYGDRIKTILDDELNESIINYDMIIHSRGQIIEQDNLIAFEMKKANRPQAEMNSD